MPLGDRKSSNRGTFFIFELMKYALVLAVLCLVAACDDPPKTTAEMPPSEIEDSLASIPEVQKLTERILQEPGNADLYLERAQVLRSRALFGAAMQDANRALRLDTLNDKALNLKALIHLDQADFDAAYALYDKCIEANDQNTECLLGKAEIELLLAQFPNAIELINTSLRVDEYQPRAYWLKGRFHKETGDTALARSSYLTATELDPGFTDAWIQLGLLWTEERPEFAAAHYKSALEADPLSTDALYNLGLLTQNEANGNEEKLREAMGYYQQLAETDPMDSRAHFNQGFIQLEYFQHYDSAAVFFTEAIARFALYHQAYYNRGLCRESLGDSEGALQDYEQALIIKPEFTPAARAKGRVLGE